MAVLYPIRARGPRKDLSGERFGKLTVRCWAGDSRWTCDCDCGGSADVFTANLKRANTTSCGCIRKAASSRRATTHGLGNTPAYKTWCSVKKRCRAPNSGRAYQQYGARGINMHDEWADNPEAFIRDVGQPPTANHTIDRIDNTKGYFPGNVRWATPLEQANNKSNNRFVTYQGERYTVSQLARKIAEECGITHAQMLGALEKVMYRRIKSGA